MPSDDNRVLAFSVISHARPVVSRDDVPDVQKIEIPKNEPYFASAPMSQQPPHTPKPLSRDSVLTAVSSARQKRVSMLEYEGWTIIAANGAWEDTELVDRLVTLLVNGPSLPSTQQ